VTIFNGKGATSITFDSSLDGLLIWITFVQCLFPTEKNLASDPVVKDILPYDRNIETNPAQLQAVR
jgi:hypothetical protein